MRIVTLLTLPLLFLYSPGLDTARTALSVLAVMGIVISPLRLMAWYWFSVTTLIGVGLLQTWVLADNHHFLMGYWSLALALSLCGDAADTNLRHNARRLVGYSFLFAVLWKTIAKDYLDGRFFEFALLLDARFGWMAEQFGGVSAESQSLNHSAHAALYAYDSMLAEVALASAPGIYWFSLVITYVVYLAEVAVAMAFLAPVESTPGRWSHVILLIFVLATYAVAPVYSFGWLLAVMGLSTTKREEAGIRNAYFVTVLIVQLYAIVDLLTGS